MTDHEGAPPPGDVTEGWKPDPSGDSDWRWWDGSSWTERVGASQKAAATLAPAASGITAPNKVCPHCGAAAQTTSKKCPSCGKGYNKRTGLKIFAGICIVGLVLLIGTCALIVAGVGNVVNELNEEQERSAISKAQYDALEIGMTQREVIASTGKQPEDRQTFQSESFLDEEPANSSCIYYNQEGGEFLDSYQLCFDEGVLTSKNVW